MRVLFIVTIIYYRINKRARIRNAGICGGDDGRLNSSRRAGIHCREEGEGGARMRGFPFASLPPPPHIASRGENNLLSGVRCLLANKIVKVSSADEDKPRAALAVAGVLTPP